MYKKAIIIIVISVTILVLLISFFAEYIINQLQFHWLNIIYAFLLAIVAAMLINYLYKKYSTKSKMLQTTVTPPPKSSKYLAKLILKEKHEFIIKEYERTFGREDFVGVIVADDLLFIGKKHFKINKKNDGYYIEDLNTKNGTQINGQEIEGRGIIKLENRDDIRVANILSIKYIEQHI